MESNKKKTEEGEDGKEDHINRLSDDLILFILIRVLGSFPNMKCLPRICLVSKRFTSIVLQTPNVFLEIPNWYIPKIAYFHTSTSCGFVLHSRRLLSTWVDSKVSRPIIYLKKFSSIQSLFIQLQLYRCRYHENYFVRWIAEFRASKPHSFVVVRVPKRTHGMRTIGDDELTTDLIDLKMEAARFHTGDADSSRYELLKILVAKIPDLKELVITDSKEQG